MDGHHIKWMDVLLRKIRTISNEGLYYNRGEQMNLRNNFHCEGPCKEVLKSHIDIIDTEVLKELLRIIKEEIDRRNK